MAHSKGLEGQLIESKNRAKENANAAQMLQSFLNSGQMRINEKGQFEIVAPRNLEQAIKPNIVKKPQQQS